MKTMAKKDWIILRLVKLSTDINPRGAYESQDLARSYLYLGRKYGYKFVSDCMYELRVEAGDVVPKKY